MRSLIAYVFFPLWLMSGLIHYLCHRRTQIASTSGRIEASLHVLQFLLLGLALCVASAFAQSWAAVTLIGLLVIAHTALSLVDVSYTIGRRYISALEQHVHGFLDVLPLVAWILIMADTTVQRSPGWGLLFEEPTSSEWLVLVAYIVLTGIPVIEEFARTQSQQLKKASPP